MRGHGGTGEYENEPIPGLPDRLPAGEELLWQGSPCWKALALRAFHLRSLALYFGLLLVWAVAAGLWEAQPLGELLGSAARLLLLGALAALLLGGIAWLQRRATVYTITNQRVVIRFGVALPMAVNLPFRAIESAHLKRFRDGTGDISLAVEGSGQLGYLLLWPYARPWHLGERAQPMLRALPEAASVAGLLGTALAASNGAGEVAPREKRTPSLEPAAA